MAKAKRLRPREKEGPKGQKAPLAGALRSRELFLVAAVFVLAALSMIIAPYWGSMKVNEYSFTSFYLEDFDKQAFPDSNFCFSVAIETQNLAAMKNDLAVFIGPKVALFEKLNYREDEKSFRVRKSYCLKSELLEFGSNRVTVSLGPENVFFSIGKKYEVRKQESYELKMTDLNRDAVSFSLALKNFDRFEPVKVFVNGKLDHSVYPADGDNSFSEKISLSEGKNVVEVVFRDSKASSEIEFVPPQKMNPLAGALIFAAGLAVMMFFVFSKEDFCRKAMLSFMSIFFILIALGFLLNLAGALSLMSFVSLYCAAIIALALVFRKNFSFSGQFLGDLRGLLNPMILLVLLGAVILPLTFNLFTVSPFSYWNTYYERQAATLSENFSMPLQDDLSYLGRPLGFIPGYFFLEAGFSWIFGLDGNTLFAVAMILANVFFLFAVFSLGKALKFSRTKICILYAPLWTENFIRGALMISPRHAFSLGLFIVAMALLLENRKKVLSGVSLALCAFVQFPLLPAFPFLYMILAKKIDWKSLLKVLAVALVIFGALFAPNFAHFGMLTQAESSNWGYLINYDALNIFLDIGALIVFFLLFTLWDAAKRSFWDSYKAKLFIFAVAGLLFQVFVSYRWNIFNSINIAVFLVLAIPEKSIMDRHFMRLLSVLILLAGVIMATGIGALSISNFATVGYDYLSKNTSSSDNLLPDPLFGHDIAYFCDRKVLADLAVEYASEQKLGDAFDFIENKDYSVLKRYSIGWVFTQSDFINRKAFGNKPLDHQLEFEKLDKVFTNGLFYIHWVGSNKLD